MSVPVRKMAVITEKPWIDCERIASRAPTPFIARSTGVVTSASTSSGDNPGASVMTTTCGGANSGNTSSFAWNAAKTP